jgi:hypothetical protein
MMDIPEEIQRLRRTIIDWISIETDAVKLKELNRYVLGIDGDSLEIQQLHLIQDSVDQLTNKVKILQKGVFGLAGVTGFLAARIGMVNYVDPFLKSLGF